MAQSKDPKVHNAPSLPAYAAYQALGYIIFLALLPPVLVYRSLLHPILVRLMFISTMIATQNLSIVTIFRSGRKGMHASLRTTYRRRYCATTGQDGPRRPTAPDWRYRSGLPSNDAHAHDETA